MVYHDFIEQIYPEGLAEIVSCGRAANHYGVHFIGDPTPEIYWRYIHAPIPAAKLGLSTI